MKKKKCIAAGALAAFLLCESLFTPNLAGMGAGLLKVQAAAANVSRIVAMSFCGPRSCS